MTEDAMTTLDDFASPDACPCCFDEGGGFGNSPCPACGLPSVHAYDERDAADEQQQFELDDREERN
jgi:hypothetical protein